MGLQSFFEPFCKARLNMDVKIDWWTVKWFAAILLVLSSADYEEWFKTLVWTIALPAESRTMLLEIIMVTYKFQCQRRY